MAIQAKHFSITYPAILLWCISFSHSWSFATPTSTSATTATKDNKVDRLALLAIKSQIHDSLRATNSWNDSVPLCRWNGITCGHRHRRITKLDLSNQNLEGSLSPFVGNLSFLRVINLTNNNFSGEIPDDVGRLFRLEILVLSNNSFSGRIPANLSRCLNLVEFDASNNYLVGNIPAEVGYLSKLQIMAISFNQLTGHLPASIGNLSALQKLIIVSNGLRGSLPETLGQLKSLTSLQVSENMFSGIIPPPVYNISSLRTFNLGGNQFHGNLPFDIGFTLPNLQYLMFAANNFTGALPKSLSNSSNLEMLEIPINHFSGKVPINFSGLRYLSVLNVGRNNLGSGASSDLGFIRSLTNCSMLQILGLYDNQFGGVLPQYIANLSVTMIGIGVGTNKLVGKIPLGITNLVSLDSLGLELNQLTGTIPATIGNLGNLQQLTLGGNNFFGRIPVSIGNLSILAVLDLGMNSLEGSIPPELGKCQNLIQLRLSSNRLTSSLPKQIFTIITLSLELSVNDNLLTGALPLEVGNLKNLIELRIDRNQFSGKIPITLGACSSLEVLLAYGNSLNGSIPSSLSSLRNIKWLDLSQNNLSGQIPKYFENFAYLEFLNLSFNHFEGEVPRGGIFQNSTAVSLDGNEKLCGGPSEWHLQSCPIIKEFKKAKPRHLLRVVLIACGILGSASFLSSILFCWFKWRKTKKEPPEESSLRNSFPSISYHQLLKATNGFSSANLIGEGSFGQVYIGNLNQKQDVEIIAVKVLNLQNRRASKSFIAECETMRNIRHRNLVKLITACSSVDFHGNPFNALVYEFMPNGNLDKWLHIFPEQIEESGEPRSLNFLQRLNIAIDVASALDYLHHHCHEPIVHCDLKPSNILLDDDMVAHVGDFGLARILPKDTDNFHANPMSSVGLKGTIGYAAPEYGTGCEVTMSGDVYSYGILLLELFTRKGPTDNIFKDGFTLHAYTELAFPEQVAQIVDPLLLHDSIAATSRSSREPYMNMNKMQEYLILVLRIGLACSVESPRDRIDISYATNQLQLIRNKFLMTETQEVR